MAASLRRDFLHPASAMVMLGSDCLSWLLSSFYEFEQYAPALVGSAAFAGVCVWLVEGIVSDPLRALAKAVLAAVIVWLPGLIAGAVVGVAALAWWASVRLAERRERHRY